MKNNLARSSSQSTNSEPQKKINVVQCPACQTKFAVDGAQLSGVEIPRFHCSRCDNVFTVDRVILGLDRTPQPVERTIKSVEPKPQQVIDDHQFEFNFPASDSPVLDSGAKSFDFDSADFREEETMLSMTGDDFGVSVMKDPFEPDSLSPVSDRELESKLFAGLSSGQMNQSASISSPFLQAPVQTPSLGDEPMGYAPFNRNASRPVTSDWSDSILSEDMVAPSRSIDRPQRAGFLSSIDPRWRSCMIISAPLLVFLLFLSIITAFCVTNPQGASAMAQSFFPGKEMAAPSELFITNSKIKRINLESGETVSVVSGTIVNRSDLSFGEVLVEGLLFDRSGNMLGRKKINAASSLGRSRIQSLSPEMIEDLQNAKPAKRFDLKSGQEFEFTMAIPEEMSVASMAPSYFSARIYSVKERG